MNKKGWLLSFFLLSGCMVGPNYHRPCVDVPNEWVTTLEESKGSTNVAWWKQFNDPVLNGLILTALRENQDLLQATYRVQEFLGLYRITRSDQFPDLYGGAEYGRERTSNSLQPVFPGIDNPDDVYRAFLTGAWEIDLWGKLRRASQAACAELIATKEARLSVIQTLVSAVAVSYINLLRLDRQLEIAEDTAKTRKDTLDLFDKRFSAGVISRIDLSQIESQYQDALASIPAFERDIGRLEDGINVLIGSTPGPIPRANTMESLKMPEIPSGLPSDLLTQRPDIREAEQVLKAATARIGVARAAYFPTITLTGDYGGASRELSNIFKGDAKFWNYFVPVSVPIFTAGEIAGEVKAAEARRCQALAAYRQQILIAFREVEDGLVVYEKTTVQVEAQRKQVEALQTYAKLSRLRYDEGYASYLEVLDAERSLFNVQLDYTESYADLYVAMVALYKALGGGWICKANQFICNDTEIFSEESKNTSLETSSANFCGSP